MKMVQGLRRESWSSSMFKVLPKDEKEPAKEREKHCQGGRMRNKRGYVPEAKWGFNHDS